MSRTALIYAGAALAEIGGCYGFWLWWREGRSAWWLLPAMLALALFAWLLAQSEAEAAGRAYAAYGGIYILASIIWLKLVEGISPDRWDLLGGALCLAGASLILLGPRTTG